MALVLAEWSETGTEGMVWTIEDTSVTEPYMGMKIISNGMHLKVFNHDNSIAFDGVIDQDKEAGWTHYPYYLQEIAKTRKITQEDLDLLKTNGFGQPSALGYWIHWTQRGWNPDDWARLFLADPPLRVEIIQD